MRFSEGAIVASLMLTVVTEGFAQDIFRSTQIKSLRGLSEVAIVVFEPNDSAALASSLGLNTRTLADLATVVLGRNIRELRLADSTKKVPTWLELHWHGTPEAVSVQLNLWRWVTVTANKEEVFTKVWDQEVLIGNPDRAAVREQFEELLTAFASDFLRANPKRVGTPKP